MSESPSPSPSPCVGVSLPVSLPVYLHAADAALSLSQLTHKFTEHEQDARLMGGGFLRADGASFGLAAYDQRQLICYAM